MAAPQGATSTDGIEGRFPDTAPGDTPALADSGESDPARAMRVDDAWFDAPVCRNCGAALATPHCGQCGQKRAQRFSWHDLRRETWEQWRLFEIVSLRTLWRLLSKPGVVAREYVMGRRKDHMHPLKLLLLMVALLVLMLGTNQYFAYHGYSRQADAALARMGELIQSYANWSFSLSIVAIFAASVLGFRRRLGYNALEHAVLAVYCQILIIAAILVSLLPTLVWDTPAFISAYKLQAGRWMYAVKLLIVGLAFKQFFLVDLRREWLRLAAALLLYAAVSWALLRLFAYAILKLVQFQLS